MSKLLSEERIKAIIDKMYQPEQIAEAYIYVASRQKTGNVILNFKPT